MTDKILREDDAKEIDRDPKFHLLLKKKKKLTLFLETVEAGDKMKEVE